MTLKIETSHNKSKNNCYDPKKVKSAVLSIRLIKFWVIYFHHFWKANFNIISMITYKEALTLSLLAGTEMT